ncbi:MAG: 16S rRNA (cytidine(1402)-2'-O)-methyltransferase [Ignavibacteriales bacterium]|nr:MAG: 16S rRNA (cytidine(1402)-2'-O)-methyltransferase [Ignavibacteriales bacterium]
MNLESTLFIVSTPIGNLGDITLRAIETLKSSDFIICEDTRVTRNLLNHFGIAKELISLNAFNEQHKIPKLIERITTVTSVALVSDAGTPGISDPGVRLISALIRIGVKVVSVPGPSALISALSISGLPTDSFIFEGFLPQKKGRQKLLSKLAEEDRTIVLYESTYRIEKLLNELNEYMPERFIVVCRELTKKFEETWRGNPKEILNTLNTKVIKGEFVVVISPLNWKSEN